MYWGPRKRNSLIRRSPEAGAGVRMKLTIWLPENETNEPEP
jgi:hypothetical protein